MNTLALTHLFCEKKSYSTYFPSLIIGIICHSTLLLLTALLFVKGRGGCLDMYVTYQVNQLTHERWAPEVFWFDLSYAESDTRPLMTRWMMFEVV